MTAEVGVGSFFLNRSITEQLDMAILTKMKMMIVLRDTATS
jgi:hypothetical protein